MLFHELNLSREEILQSAADSLQSTDACIYVDTSVLLHCYEMRAPARQELLNAFAHFTSRLWIPLWAARETWDHSHKDLSSRPLQQPVAKLLQEVKRFVQETRRYVDDETVTQPAALSRAEYETKLEESQKNMAQVASMVANYQRRADDTSAALIPFINDRLLRSNLISILAKVRDEAQLRSTHRVPPGFRDAGAGSETDDRGKKENKYGDLIIWFEMLEHAKERDAKHLVLITRDIKKGDWAYVPQRLKDEHGRMTRNLSVTLAHPLLVHEALSYCPKLGGVHILSLDEFVQLLTAKLNLQTPELLAALQFEDMAKQPATAPPDIANQSSAPGALAGPVTFSPTDLAYPFTEGNKIDRLIQDLRISDYRIQAIAVRQLEPVLGEASRDQLIQIGRGLARAAIMRALAPFDLLAGILADMMGNPTTRSYVLVGALAAIYLTDQAELKKPISSPNLTTAIFAASGDQMLSAAFETVLARLQPQRKQYLALPTEGAAAIPLTLTLERGPQGPATLRGLLSGDYELLEEGAAQSRRLVPSTGPEMDVEELLSRLSAEFVVPAERFAAQETGAFRFTLSETLGFVRWGPGTGVDLR